MRNSGKGSCEGKTRDKRTTRDSPRCASCVRHHTTGLAPRLLSGTGLALGPEPAPEVVGVCVLEQSLALRDGPWAVIPRALDPVHVGLQVAVRTRALLPAPSINQCINQFVEK